MTRYDLLLKELDKPPFRIKPLPGRERNIYGFGDLRHGIDILGRHGFFKDEWAELL